MEDNSNSSNTNSLQAHIDAWVDKINRSREGSSATVAAFEMELISHKDILPSVESLMQEWPAKVEELFKSTDILLPSADLDCSLKDYIMIIAALLNIPPSLGPVLSLFLIFEVYNEFEKSQHFKLLTEEQI